MENGILIASMVVPAISETMSLSSFINLFIKVDLPALGLPKMAIFFLQENHFQIRVMSFYI